MDTQANILQVYKKLALCYERRGQAQMRDRFLVLAADAALSSGLTDEADQLRARLLQVNPHHLLKPYASFAQAREAPDVDTYIRNLRLNYPEEVAEDLLRAIQASEEPAAKQLQMTAPIPEAEAEEEATLRLESQDAGRRSKSWQAPQEDEMSQTAALPPAGDPSPRPRKTAGDLAHTAQFAEPVVPRARVPAKADAGSTEAGSRPATPRSRPAPRPTPAGTASPRPLSPSRPASPAAKAPTGPVSGTSPFATLGNDSAPTQKTAQRFQPLEEPAENGGWLASALFVIVGILALVFAAFTLARPFLPDGWFPK